MCRSTISSLGGSWSNLSKTGTILLQVAVVERSTHLAHILASTKGLGSQPGIRSGTHIFYDSTWIVYHKMPMYNFCYKSSVDSIILIILKSI